MLERMLRMANDGHRILFMRPEGSQFSANIGPGALFIRDFKLSGLKSVSVDTLIITGLPPTTAVQTAQERLRGQTNPQQLYIDEKGEWHDASYYLR